MVPLEEQVTDQEQIIAHSEGQLQYDTVVAEEVAVAVPESSGDAAVSQHQPVSVDPNMPWFSWPDPDAFATPVSSLTVRPLGPDASPEDPLILVGESGEDLGEMGSATAFRQLGWFATFPTDFVNKLAPATKVLVVNERLRQCPREVSVVIENERIANIVHGGRGIPPYREVAQTTYDTLKSVYGEKVDILETRQGDGEMNLRFVTGVEKPVTRKKGDILQMGVQVHQDYGHDLSLALYVNRLICTNGMTAENQEFTWRVRGEISIEHQLAWLATGVSKVVGAFDQIVAHAKQMAEIPVNGENIPAILERYARSMKFPVRYLGRVIEAYNQEPDPTQWGILNAFTRVATHGLSGALQQNILAATGTWTQEFDMVDVRLPRPVATSLGAELIGV